MKRLAVLCLGTLGVTTFFLLAACVGDDAPTTNTVTPETGTSNDAPSANDGQPQSDTGVDPDAGTDADKDAAPRPPRFLAIDATNRLVKFAKSDLGSVDNTNITGLIAGETIVGIDVRAKDGSLYGVGATGRVYRINRANGAATQLGSVLATALSGTSFGIDFVPAVDRIRMISNTGQNFRINPDDGTFIGPDVNLAYTAADPNAGSEVSGDGLATLPGTPEAGAPSSFIIDAPKRTLAAFAGNPNGGLVQTIGSLGLPPGVISQVGFDIITENNVPVAYMVANQGGAAKSTLYQINLETGAATAIGLINASPLRALTHEL